MDTNHLLNTIKANAKRSTLWILVLLGLMAAPPAMAQKGEVEIGAGLGAMSLDDKLGGDDGLSLVLRLGYFLTDRFEIEIQNTRASSALDGSFNATTLNGVYHFGGLKRFVPYVLFGIGRAEVELDEILAEPIEDDDTALRAAVGGRFRLGEEQRASLRLELGALREGTFEEDSNHVGLSLSFGWNFGGRKDR